MIIGLDIGSSAVKIVAVEQDRILYTQSLVGSVKTPDVLLRDFLSERALTEQDIEKIAVTGVGAESCRFESMKCPVQHIPEIEASGEGGTWLAELHDAVVVSIGTGTAIALARDGAFTHIGGTGVGSGTLRGLSKKLFGIDDVCRLFALAETGNRLTVDLTIGDLFSGTDTLPLDLTASNLAKCQDCATDSDWAYAVINTVMEVAGSHAALACVCTNTQNVIIIGGISQTELAKKVYDNFSKLYKLNYVIPSYSGCATAIGAARRAQHGA